MTTPTKIVCDIDGSLTSSGIVVGSQRDVLWMGKFGTAAKDSMPKRLWQIHHYFFDLFSSWHVEEVAFESKFVNMGKDPQGALNLGRVDGAIMMAAEALEIPCVWYPPSTIKKVSAGKGNASKDDVQEAMKARFKDHPIVRAATPAKVLNPKTGKMNKNKVDDLWDALAIWYTHTNPSIKGSTLQSNPA